MSDPLDLNLNGVSITWRIHVMKRYAELMEAKLGEAYQMEMATPDWSSDQDLYLSETSAIEDYYENGFIPTFRYSFLVSLHMIAETSLRELCNGLKADRKLALGPSDLKGSPFDQCRLFLTKVFGLRADDFKSEWEGTRDLQKVRNCIVHALGVVEDMPNDKKVIKDLVAARSDITIDYNGKLIPTKMFCLSQVTAVEHLFDKLFRLVGWQK